MLKRLVALLVPKAGYSDEVNKWLNTTLPTEKLPAIVPSNVVSELAAAAQRQGIAISSFVSMDVDTHIPTFCTDLLTNNITKEGVSLLLDELYSTARLPIDIQQLIESPEAQFYILCRPHDIKLLEDHLMGNQLDKLKKIVKMLEYQNILKDMELREDWALRITEFLTKYFTDFSSLPEHMFGDLIKDINTPDFTNIYAWWKSQRLYRMQQVLCWITKIQQMSGSTRNKHSKARLVIRLANQEELGDVLIDENTHPENNTLSLAVVKRVEHLSRINYPEIHTLVMNILTESGSHLSKTDKHDLNSWESYLDKDNDHPDDRPHDFIMSYAPPPPKLDIPRKELVIINIPMKGVRSLDVNAVLRHDLQYPSGLIDKLEPVVYSDIVPNAKFDDSIDKVVMQSLLNDVKQGKYGPELLRLIKEASSIIDTTIVPKLAHPPICGGQLGFIKYCSNSCYVDSVLLPFLYHHPFVFNEMLAVDLKKHDRVYNVNGEEMHLIDFPYLLFVHEKIQNFLRNAYVASSNGQVFSVTPFRKLLQIYVKVRKIVIGGYDQFELNWTRHQLEGLDIWLLLSEMFTGVFYGTLVYMKWTWNLAKDDTYIDALAKATTTLPDYSEVDLGHSCVFILDINHAKVVNLEYEISKKLTMHGENNPDVREHKISAYRLVDAPYILIWVKRLISDDKRGRIKRKVDVRINAPQILTCANTRVLQLSTVVEHIGNANMGHYISYIRCKGPLLSWVKYDDTKAEVTTVDKFPDSVGINSTMYLYVP
jgi:hypothetical protein